MISSYAIDAGPGWPGSAAQATMVHRADRHGYIGLRQARCVMGGAADAIGARGSSRARYAWVGNRAVAADKSKGSLRIGHAGRIESHLRMPYRARGYFPA